MKKGFTQYINFDLLRNIKVFFRKPCRSCITGFTLLEITVVISIIILLGAAFIISFRGSEKRFALQRSAYKLAQDLRRAQKMAMAARDFEGAFQGGYGINFTVTPQNEEKAEYTLFVDCNNNNIFDGSFLKVCDDCTGGSCINGVFSEKVETIFSEGGIKIDTLSPSGPLNIIFLPPDPTIIINGDPQINSASISLTFDSQTKKTIAINKTGLIEIK